ncbi:MAG: hypothetical protein AAB507_01415 [Patescibacteria group bacterium]
MSSVSIMSMEFKKLIDEYLFSTKARGFWEIRGTYVLVSWHNGKNVSISGFLDEISPDHPNHVICRDSEGNREFIPVEWVTIVSAGVNPPKKWLPIKKNQKRGEKNSPP